MYVLTTQEVYTHIPKHNWVHINRFALKANDSRGIHVYLKVWQNTHIHEMKTHDHKSNPKSGNTSLKMYVSSKPSYTSTFHGFK